jgi:NAD(P)-dependent dehydrogenase (short-subunit alcohol dehydrogenase family)
MNILIFGKGCIGSHLIKKFKSRGENVIVATRDIKSQVIPKLDAAIWCHGINCNDKIGQLNTETYSNIIDVNLHYTTKTLDFLLKNDKLDTGSRCLIISSLWQEYSRSDKFSYTVSKAALGGLVRSCSVDLGEKGIFINAILPGPLDNEMTRTNLTEEQIKCLPGFVDVDDVWYLSEYLCVNNKSMNGQSLIVDLGFSVKKM